MHGTNRPSRYNLRHPFFLLQLSNISFESKSKENSPPQPVRRRPPKVSTARLIILHLIIADVGVSAGISATLQAQHATFLSLAGKTAALDADLQKIKTLYTQLWRSKTGSVRDPFNELDRMLESGGDYGMGDLNVK